MSYWLFFCASAKLTHRYITHANQPRIMEHLEQENRKLKDEIARLTTMMESVLAAQNQSSPTPITPPSQRIVISEVATSTVPATQFAITMPAGFLWGMPPNFVSEGLRLHLLLCRHLARSCLFRLHLFTLCLVLRTLSTILSRLKALVFIRRWTR